MNENFPQNFNAILNGITKSFLFTRSIKKFSSFRQKKNFANFSPEGRLAGFMVFR
jgi:hypothetical protein